MAWITQDDRLSLQQRTVLIDAARGCEVQQTAAAMCLSQWTIRQHRRDIMFRLSTHSITHALGRAVALGIITPEEIEKIYTPKG